MARHILLFLLAFAALFGAFSAAATCSADAYKKACATCPFDSYGKMGKTCYDGLIDNSINCMAAAYPVLDASYSAGKCPDVDTCRSNLEICKETLHGASDKEDCGVAAIQECYSEADTCLAEANKKCDVKLEDVARACPMSFGIVAFVALIVLFRI